MERDAAGDGAFDPTDPVHVAELVCYLASPEAGWVSGQTFQVSGARIQHVTSWSAAQTLERTDAGWCASDLAHELPRMFGAGPRAQERPPVDWSDRYHAKREQ
jgi:3-oxoacyl-[acyl-carrier protein] reductase